jgi:hypothetical protein
LTLTPWPEKQLQPFRSTAFYLRPKRVSRFGKRFEPVSGKSSAVSPMQTHSSSTSVRIMEAIQALAFIMSYLLQDGSRHLLDFIDRSGEVQQSFSTLPIDELPAGTRAFGGTKPLFVLTSKDTISGGEDMAYGLQAFNRAIAIVGERNEATAGAANPNTKPHFLCEEEFGDKWWLAGIPTSKPVHSVTLSNWEGIGVRSDVVAGKGEWIGVDDAKEVATRLAMRVLGHGKNES